MDKNFIIKKQGEVDAVRLNLHDGNRVKNKNELIRRLDHIQYLAKQKNYVEIERLVQESYV